MSGLWDAWKQQQQGRGGRKFSGSSKLFQHLENLSQPLAMYSSQPEQWTDLCTWGEELILEDFVSAGCWSISSAFLLWRYGKTTTKWRITIFRVYGWTQLATISIVDFSIRRSSVRMTMDRTIVPGGRIWRAVSWSRLLINKFISTSGDEDKQTRTNGGSDYILWRQPKNLILIIIIIIGIRAQHWTTTTDW